MDAASVLRMNQPGALALHSDPNHFSHTSPMKGKYLLFKGAAQVEGIPVAELHQAQTSEGLPW